MRRDPRPYCCSAIGVGNGNGLTSMLIADDGRRWQSMTVATAEARRCDFYARSASMMWNGDEDRTRAGALGS